MEILEFIKSKFKKNKSVDKICDSIVKNKKLTDNEKFNQMLMVYGEYFKNIQHDKVDLEVYENNFEYIIIDGYLHEYRYEKVLKETEENDTYIVCKQFIDQIKKLKYFNKNNCNKKQIEIVNNLVDVSKKYSNEFGKNGYENIINSCNNLKSSLVEYVTPEKKKDDNEEENLFGF